MRAESLNERPANFERMYMYIHCRIGTTLCMCVSGRVRVKKKQDRI